MKTLPLTPKILSVILAVQTRVRAVVRKRLALKALGMEMEPKDHHVEARKLFFSLPLDEIGLKTNERCFEAVTRYRVTDEMMDMLPDKLPTQFDFSY